MRIKKTIKKNGFIFFNDDNEVVIKVELITGCKKGFFNLESINPKAFKNKYMIHINISGGSARGIEYDIDNGKQRDSDYESLLKYLKEKPEKEKVKNAEKKM